MTTLPFRAPGSRDLRTARFLQTFAELLEAGLTPAVALEQEGVRRLAGSGVERAIAALRTGLPFSEALRLLNFTDRIVSRVEAAEAAGRVPAALHRIAAERTRTAQLLQRAISKLLYPVFLIHFAAFARGITIYAKSGAWPGIAAALWIVVPVDIVILLIAYAVRDAASGGASFSLVSRLPFASAALRDLALAPFLRSLSDLYESGMPLNRAVLAASRGTNIQFSRTMESAAAEVAAGHALLPSLVKSEMLDDTLIAILQPAEVSGTLGDALPRAAELVETRLQRNLQFSANAPGSILYGGAVLLIVWVLFQFYAGYFDVFKYL